MSMLETITSYLPEVQPPKQKRLSFNIKLKWTLLILLLYYIMGMVPLYGLSPQSLSQFEFLATILGAKFGSLISLGIGPIVTASIVLQLLQGAKLLKFDLNTKEGKSAFTSLQKLLTIGFIVFESIIYVTMGGLKPSPGVNPWILIIQLILGGLIIMLFDEVVSKWGFGQGVSLFIVAGVSQQAITQMISWLPSANNPDMPIGAIPIILKALPMGAEGLNTATVAIARLLATLFVFAIAVYFQAMKVEIPLAYGRIRGHGVRWPLAFIYTSNIPVILIAALLANIRLMATLINNPTFTAITQWLTMKNLLQAIVTHSVTPIMIAQSLTYLLFLMGGSVLFSIFWVQTSGMDAKSQAERIMASGLQVPGFRKDRRVLERMLNRYIWPLSVMGALAVGFLAGVADLTGAFGRGTGILLSVMIIYRLYEEIAKQHAMDMNPMLRRFMEK